MEYEFQDESSTTTVSNSEEQTTTLKYEESTSQQYFSCYRTNSEIVQETQMFDECEGVASVEEEGIKIFSSGRFRITFTGLLKTSTNNSILVEIHQTRNNDSKLLGSSELKFSALQGEPEIGLSTSIDIIEFIETGDFIEVSQKVSDSDSFLRSSEWKLLRVEGHLIDTEGLQCRVEQNKIKCNSDEKETDRLKITEAGFYELALYGQANLVSIQG